MDAVVPGGGIEGMDAASPPTEGKAREGEQGEEEEDLPPSSQVAEPRKTVPTSPPPESWLRSRYCFICRTGRGLQSVCPVCNVHTEKVPIGTPTIVYGVCSVLCVLCVLCAVCGVTATSTNVYVLMVCVVVCFVPCVCCVLAVCTVCCLRCACAVWCELCASLCLLIDVLLHPLLP